MREREREREREGGGGTKIEEPLLFPELSRIS